MAEVTGCAPIPAAARRLTHSAAGRAAKRAASAASRSAPRRPAMAESPGTASSLARSASAAPRKSQPSEAR